MAFDTEISATELYQHIIGQNISANDGLVESIYKEVFVGSNERVPNSNMELTGNVIQNISMVDNGQVFYRYSGDELMDEKVMAQLRYATMTQEILSSLHDAFVNGQVEVREDVDIDIEDHLSPHIEVDVEESRYGVSTQEKAFIQREYFDTMGFPASYI